MNEQLSPYYTPGNEPPELKEKLENFFRSVDGKFPDRIIVWKKWNHKKWDRTASFLMNELGYSRGMHFLNAYGYYVEVDRDYLTALPVEEDAPEQGEIYTGTVVSVLRYGHSGFVHCNETERDYYFNIRDFTERIKLIEMGRPVTFKLKRVLNRKTGSYVLNAVDLSYEKNTETAYT